MPGTAQPLESQSLVICHTTGHLFSRGERSNENSGVHVHARTHTLVQCCALGECSVDVNSSEGNMVERTEQWPDSNTAIY